MNRYHVYLQDGVTVEVNADIVLHETPTVISFFIFTEGQIESQKVATFGNALGWYKLP